MNKRMKDLVIVAVVAAVIFALDLIDGDFQWRMDIGEIFLILLIIFWMRSLKRTRTARREIRKNMEAGLKLEQENPVANTDRERE